MSEISKELEDGCQAGIDHLKRELSRLRTGRASSGLLESLNVDYYGSPVPLQQLGLIHVPEPRMLTIQVYDQGAVESIEKAILQSDLGLNPSRDGNLIRVHIPALTEERRKELVKTVHKIGEETKISIRNHRRDAIDQMKAAVKAKEMSEDEQRRGQEEVQKITDRFIKQVETLSAEKEKEMMEV